MIRLKKFLDFLNENTLFNPGIFEEELNDAISKPPVGSLYIEKQLAIGTEPHIKMIAKKLGMDSIKIDCAKLDHLKKYLIDPIQKDPEKITLVILDGMEKASEHAIDFIKRLEDKREIAGNPISDLYYFVEIHLIDKSIVNYNTPKNP